MDTGKIHRANVLLMGNYENTFMPVSYTHLDVYKRQEYLERFAEDNMDINDLINK